MSRLEVKGLHFASDGASSFSQDHLSSAEGFAAIPFYAELNKALLSLASPAQRVLDLGTGTGAVIGWLSELGKLKDPFQAIGIDLNKFDLVKAREKFSALGDSVQFIQGDVENLPIPDSSMQLVTALNFIHLCSNPQKVLQEAFRVLEPGGRLLLDSAYVKGLNKEFIRQWFNIFKFPRRILADEYELVNIPNPPSLEKYTKEQYAEMAQAAGFTGVKVEEYTAKMSPDEAKDLVSVPEFALGSLPGVILELSQKIHRRAVDKTLETLGIPEMRRNWMFLSGEKPLPAAA